MPDATCPFKNVQIAMSFITPRSTAPRPSPLAAIRALAAADPFYAAASGANAVRLGVAGVRAIPSRDGMRRRPPPLS
ncbi:hypothetical protein [Nannocystis pusilla]|uniref:hypothetical protein n=1 Tax=Nannocystis pusilla TaxID=889268 RepID=UPI003BF43EAE